MSAVDTGAARAFLPVDHLLRSEGRHRVAAPAPPWGELVGITAAAAFVYGAALGAYSGQPLQMLYSGLKAPLLLAVSTAVCLPSFYVLNAALGLRGHLAAALHAIVAGQATLAVALAALAPVTVLLYFSGIGYDEAIVASGGCFLAAAMAAQWMIARHYRPLVRLDAKHRASRACWLLIYVFVAIQSAWVLRPFVGAPGLETTFLRENAWSNAYVRVLRAVLDVLEGR